MLAGHRESSEKGLLQGIIPTPIFAKEKPRNAEREIGRRLTKPTKEQNMEYLILVAVVSMMALYALIIVGCLRQPEW
ncbi:MAG: hypothetical protein ACM3NN_10575 [Nitrospirota bacterium]|jgi:hypothetical protein